MGVPTAEFLAKAYYHRPQRSCFYTCCLSVILFTEGGGVLQTLPWADTPLPPQADTTPGQTSPLGRHPQQTPPIDNPFQAEIPWADTPRQRTPPPPSGHCSRWYASYWNAFLFGTDFFAKNCMEMKLDLGCASQQIHQ